MQSSKGMNKECFFNSNLKHDSIEEKEWDFQHFDKP